MTPILLGLAIAGVLMLLLALFAGRGAGERVRGPRQAIDLSLPELAQALKDTFTSRGFTVLSEVVEPGHADLLLKDASPLTGQTVALRCLLPPDGVAVDSLEVQAALDRVRGDQMEKAIVATPGQFTSAARLLAEGANVELLDGAALEQLLGRPGRPGPARPVHASP